MKSLYSIIIVVICLAPIAYSQVDTLEAIEVGTINVPDSITQLYVKDLDGDSLKELILCTRNHVYVYNTVDTLPIWTSPELIRPTDLKFGDVDGDSILEICSKCAYGIYVVDLQDSVPLYSISTNSQYRCYAIGDVNNDGLIDLAYATQYNFDSVNRLDSVYVNIKYGPDYNSNSSIRFIIENGGDSHSWYWQVINSAAIEPLGNLSSLQPRILLASRITSGYYITIPPGGSGYQLSGQYWVINPQNMQIISNQISGRADVFKTVEANNIRNGYCISSYTGYSGAPGRYLSTVKKYILRLPWFGSIDSMRILYNYCEQNSIFNPPDWTFRDDEINTNLSGPELAYEFSHFLYEYSIINALFRWSAASPVDSANICGVFNSTGFPSPEIVIKKISTPVQYLFMNGITHEVNTILPNLIPTISQIADLNNDGNDEILSISGNTLHIYNLDWATPVAERPILPSEYLAVSNYPNPFNAQTIIKYNLPRQCDMALEIYDILGRKIESFEKPNQPAGLGQITWDASGEPSGVYFYRLSAGSEQKIGRMVLLK